MSDRQEQKAEKQPSQEKPPRTSDPRTAEHAPESTVREGYEAAEDPEQQGDGDPRPRPLTSGSADSP